MKKIYTRSIWMRLALGVLCSLFLMPTGQVVAEEDQKCSVLSSQQEQCESRYDCRWHEAWSMTLPSSTGGTPSSIDMPAKCAVGAEVCRSINDREKVDRAAMCKTQECEWREKSEVCRPQKGSCDGRNQVGCLVNKECRWLAGKCRIRPFQSDIKAVQELDGICDCKNDMPVWSKECDVEQNKFWQESIPGTCELPLTNKEVEWFCNTNSDLLRNYGKRQCRQAIVHVVRAGEQQCLDDSEMQFQRSLKDSAARSQRRENNAACRANAEQLYPGAVFSGGGLRSGAILAHEHLTKSISHETDLKSLILSWTKFVLELVAIIAVLAVIWAGILYITDMGDGTNQEKAKKILMWVVIGILLILGSYAIVNTLMKADLGSDRVAISPVTSNFLCLDNAPKLENFQNKANTSLCYGGLCDKYKKRRNITTSFHT